MKTEKNNKQKENIVAGASGLAGAAAGVAGAAVLSAEEAEAKESTNSLSDSATHGRSAVNASETNDNIKNPEDTSNDNLNDDENNPVERLNTQEIPEDPIEPEPIISAEPEPVDEPSDNDDVLSNNIGEVTSNPTDSTDSTDNTDTTDTTGDIVAETRIDDEAGNLTDSDLTAEVIPGDDEVVAGDAEVITVNAEVIPGDYAENIQNDGVDAVIVEPEFVEVSLHNDDMLAEEISVNQIDIDLHDADIDVLGYDRLTNENGDQIEAAAVNINGNSALIVDTDLDGTADYLMSDQNNNGVIEGHEQILVQDQGFEMQPLQDAAGFNTALAQDDLPDYVNDADVDIYMA